MGSGDYHYSVEIPTRDAAILKDEFLYDYSGFPSAHASTIIQLKNGDLVAAYFGGTFERNPDVCIWVSRKPKGAKAWEKLSSAADGGLFAWGTPEAKKAGLSGIDEKATPADKGLSRTDCAVSVCLPATNMISALSQPISSCLPI